MLISLILASSALISSASRRSSQPTAPPSPHSHLQAGPGSTLTSNLALHVISHLQLLFSSLCRQQKPSPELMPGHGCSGRSSSWEMRHQAANSNGLHHSPPLLLFNPLSYLQIHGGQRRVNQPTRPTSRPGATPSPVVKDAIKCTIKSHNNTALTLLFKSPTSNGRSSISFVRYSGCY